jgi:hypothetical protein
MDNLTLIMHLRQRSFQLREEWVKQAGACYLLTEGFKYEDAHGLIPMPTYEGITPEKELALRKAEVDDMKRRIDELEAEIQRLGKRDPRDQPLQASGET